ncbi:MAG: hypothetical protein U0441_31050 [Polyangiaceae bacterium]
MSVEDLNRRCEERPCMGDVGPGYYAHAAARMPPIRGEILRWFRSALADDSRKWVAAALLRLKPEAVSSLASDLLLAAMSEPNPSFNRAFVRPLRGAIDWQTAVDSLLRLAKATDPLARGGVARTSYWLRVELGPPDPTSARMLNTWILREFLQTSDAYAERSLIAAIVFDEQLIDDDARELLPQAVTKARAHPDEYVRHRLAINLKESTGPFMALTRD